MVSRRYCLHNKIRNEGHSSLFQLTFCEDSLLSTVEHVFCQPM